MLSCNSWTSPLIHKKYIKQLLYFPKYIAWITKPRHLKIFSRPQLQGATHLTNYAQVQSNINSVSDVHELIMQSKSFPYHVPYLTWSLAFISSQVLVFLLPIIRILGHLLRYKVTNQCYLKYFKNTFKMNIYED